MGTAQDRSKTGIDTGEIGDRYLQIDVREACSEVSSIYIKMFLFGDVHLLAARAVGLH